MRTIRLVCVGKLKRSARYLEAGIDLYAQRLKRHFHIEWVEVPEIAPSPTKTVSQILEAEAQAVLKHCDPDDRLVVLSERGKKMDSPAFSNWLFGADGNPLSGGRWNTGSGRMIFIIGGAYGTSETLIEKADETLSLSPLTFPHQMVRLILMEQLYRAVTIQNNEPYHK